MLRTTRNACFLQAMLVARLRKRRTCHQISVIAQSLDHWRRGARVLLSMRTWTASVKRIQRFWRWALGHLAALRTRVEVRWLGLEYDIVGSELLGLPQIKDTGHQIPRYQQATASTSARSELVHDVRERKAAKKVSIMVGMNEYHHRIFAHTHAQQNEHHHAHHHHHVHNDGHASKASRRHSLSHCHSPLGKLRWSAIQEEKIRKAMFSEPRREILLRSELRIRRKKFLPAYTLWQFDMETYWQQVWEWRQDRKACKEMGLKCNLTMPNMFPYPSHLPSDEDLQELIRIALGLKSGTPEMAETHGTARLKWHTKQADGFDSSKELCEEVSGYLAPTASQPTPAAPTSGLRPSVPLPL